MAVIELGKEKIRLELYDTKAAVPIQTLAPGTYSQPLLTQGNSILSTVFLKAADAGASVEVRYYDFGVGGPPDVERVDLTSHTILTDADVGGSDRILVTRLHDKPVLEIEVLGGNVEMGVYVTVVASFASDLDSALVKDGQTADLNVNKGIPTVCYDEDQNKFFLLRCESGTLPVSLSEAGDSIHLRASTTTTPGMIQSLISSTVPTGKKRKLSRCRISCRSHGAFEVIAGGVKIGGGLTSPMHPVDEIIWSPREEVAASQVIQVRYLAHSGSPSGACLDALLMGSDITA